MKDLRLQILLMVEVGSPVSGITNKMVGLKSATFLFTPYTTVYTTHTLGRFSMLDISSVGIMSVPKKVGVGKHLAESFPKTYYSVMAPSWLSSNRVRKTAPRVCDVHVVYRKP